MFSNVSSDILNNIFLLMKKKIKNFNIKIDKFNIGKPSVDIFNNIIIDYYNVPTPLKNISNIIVKNSTTVQITVFDKSMVNIIKNSIILKNLDLYPYTADNHIFIPFPVLTTEKKNKIVKIFELESENAKINIRNIRREGNEKIKLLSKNKQISLDEEHLYLNKIQLLTDENILKIDKIILKKINSIKKI
ncbi:ribosome-recycling factor [Buchnera aphidicola (Mollitrichosiphum nigrofasciatum)]|uniref:ribosome-recycling factor n=1 Tax=Buchnera aphidicola TaxID=9 RepID=UPI0031B817F0